MDPEAVPLLIFLSILTESDELCRTTTQFALFRVHPRLKRILICAALRKFAAKISLQLTNLSRRMIGS
jgi:hypothetical protein